MIVTDEKKLKEFSAEKRIWQGIPSIEKTKKGRLFAAFYSGGTKEEPGNFVVVTKSDDDGRTWRDVAVVYDGRESRCFDECLWIDPAGRLWLFWSRMPAFDVCAAVCEQPDEAKLRWSDPVRIGAEVMMNKPIVLRDGRWLLPAAVWDARVSALTGFCSEKKDRRAFAVESSDNGASFRRLGGVAVPERSFDEHMFLERRDGRIAVYVRTHYGIAIAFSSDGGRNWSQGKDSGLGGPDSRFFIRRLKSGNVLLVNHVRFSGRNNLTAMLSLDDGETFEGGLLLDERAEVSYPDGVEDDDGYIYVAYDRERGAFKRSLAENQAAAREILFAKFTEADVLAGKLTDCGSRLKNIICKLGVFRGKDPYPLEG